MRKVTNDFRMFMEESNGVGQAFMSTVMKISEVTSLDPKIHELSYISVLASLQMINGLPFHVAQAKKLGASLEEVKSAILVGLPIVGLRISEPFAIAINSYDSEDLNENNNS